MTDETRVEDAIQDGQAEINLTITQWSYLLQCTKMRSWPKTIGSMKFTDGERAEIVEDMMLLHRELLKYSPMATVKKDRRLVFGPKDAWEWDAEGKMPKSLKEEDKKYKVRLDGSCQNGAYWPVLYAAHPASPIVDTVDGRAGGQPPSFEDILFPIADAFGFKRQLRKDMGLSLKRKTSILRDGDSKWDEEYEAEEKPAKQLNMTKKDEKPAPAAVGA